MTYDPIEVPTTNDPGNELIGKVIGSKLDSIAGAGFSDVSQGSISGRTADNWEHAHSMCRVYPTLANGVVVTGGVAAWALGSFAVIVPANTIPSPFDIHCLNIAAVNANDTFELILYSGPNGSEAEIGRVRFTRLSNAGAAPHEPFQTPIIPANTQIKAKVASQAGTSNTCTISVMYHHY